MTSTPDASRATTSTTSKKTSDWTSLSSQPQQGSARPQPWPRSSLLWRHCCRETCYKLRWSNLAFKRLSYLSSCASLELIILLKLTYSFDLKTFSWTYWRRLKKKALLYSFSANAYYLSMCKAQTPLDSEIPPKIMFELNSMTSARGKLIQLNLEKFYILIKRWFVF